MKPFEVEIKDPMKESESLITIIGEYDPLNIENDPETYIRILEAFNEEGEEYDIIDERLDYVSTLLNN